MMFGHFFIHFSLKGGYYCFKRNDLVFILCVAHFRQVQFGQILYGGDDISGSEWDNRQWQSMKDVRKQLFQLAVDMCLQL